MRCCCSFRLNDVMLLPCVMSTTTRRQVAALRTIIRAMGKTSFHKHMFFKFQSSQTRLIPYYRKVSACC